MPGPGRSVFFPAPLPPFLGGDPARAAMGMGALGAVSVALTLAVFLLYGFLPAARDRARALPRSMRRPGRAFAAAFAGRAARRAAERA